jgi:hypothetical protein
VQASAQEHVEARNEGDPNWWDILTGIAGPASLSGPEVCPSAP